MSLSARKNCVIHSLAQIRGIREAASAAAQVRDRLPEMCQPGMSTKMVDELAGSLIASVKGSSAFLGYRGFPGNICISLNDEVVHGIGCPERIMQPGDLVSVDVGVKLNGFIGDTATSFILGEDATGETLHLLDNTEKALAAGIKAAKCGNYVRNISAAVEKVAREAKLGIVREYVGHGCGVQLHEPPEIPNFVTSNRGPRLRAGMVLCIEPMLNLGSHKVYTSASDHWTVKTKDAKLSAHFEHMILITETDPEVLTWQRM